MFVIDPVNCMQCGLCASECPTGAISIEKADGWYRIDQHKCTNCGKCFNDCPAEVICRC